uniref:Uncharacterized protein n=1 Tax=Trichuris muris TaxID=70415 RepID=A0A5S6QMX1_TRIMR
MPIEHSPTFARIWQQLVLKNKANPFHIIKASSHKPMEHQWGAPYPQSWLSWHGSYVGETEIYLSEAALTSKTTQNKDSPERISDNETAHKRFIHEKSW